LEVAPLDVAPVLSEGVWSRRTAILTTATVPLNLPQRVGLPFEGTELLDVGSPFDYATHALLYCATHLPDPRQPGHQAAVHDELQALITAAGGRTLALFTSRRAMAEAAEELRRRLPLEVLTQDDLPKPALIARFAQEETTCLFATAGLFQGIDVPGPTLSLVTIDRLPFPRPDEPLLKARRQELGPEAFRGIDLPRAATLLAQAGGRLIRTASDRGVFAVFDPRLARAGYRWDIVRALPPMRRTRHRAEVESFLREITT
jgi:ATP-dependent DNA helicase DinG